MITRRDLLRSVALLAVGGAAAGCTRTGEREELILAAGEEGGFFWEFAELTAAAADRAGLPIAIVPERTPGSVTNLATLTAGNAELALTLTDVAVRAHDEGAQFTAIGRVYENYMQLAVRADSPIRKIAQLRGARISLGAPGSGAEFTGQRILAVAGLAEPGAVTRVHLSMADAGRALVDGEIDAVLWAGGVPTPSFANLGVPLRLIDLSVLLEPLRARFGSRYEPVLIQPGTYGQPDAVATIGLGNLLLAGASVSDEAAAALVDLLVDHASELVPAQATGSQFLDRQSLIVTADVPLHPGAVAAYRRHHG